MFDWYPMNTEPSIALPTTSNDTIVGTCSLCNGPVCVPTAYHSIVPPVPTCRHCGAKKKKQNYGPVVDREPPVVCGAGGRMYSALELAGDITRRKLTALEAELKELHGY